jgi:hypothetical protein
MNKTLYKTWLYTLNNLELLIYKIFLLPIGIVVLIVTLPYSFYYKTPNYGIQENDMPPVQLYLDHFQHLHPDLIWGLQQTIEGLRLLTGKDPIPLRCMAFWPYKYDQNINQREFTSVAVLFAVLEDAGWPRRVVWTFLRDEVEKKSVELGLNDAQKGQFRYVMQKINSHNLTGWATMLTDKLVGRRMNKKTRGMVLNLEPLTDLHEVIPVSLNSLDWVLRRGCVITPSLDNAWESYERLSRLSKFSGLWGCVSEDRTLEEAIGKHWQILDNRLKMPWDE